MTEYLLRDKENHNERTFDSKEEAESEAEELRQLGATVEVEEIGSDGGEEDPVEAEVIDHTENGHEEPDESVEPEVVTADVTDPEELSKDPIGFLESVNSDFVNTIKGKPAISKQGFRFIQREFEITTESEVVEWSEDPLGCVVWARAELNDEYAAEAHGEGYQFESDVSDNEFVRYADTRAKNRAISDLTSAGALAVSELQGER